MSIVHLKNKKNGVTYVYESSAYWDKEKGQARNSRVCIGKLDSDNGKIIYNRRFKERQSDNIIKLRWRHCMLKAAEYIKNNPN